MNMLEYVEMNDSERIKWILSHSPEEIKKLLDSFASKITSRLIIP